jgi:hypothetical protein
MLSKEEYERRKAAQETKCKERLSRGWSRLFENPDRLFQGLLVIFTFGLFAVGALQWGILDRTDQTLRAAQRPWLYVTKIVPRPKQPREEGGKIVFDLDVFIQNIGHSPAFVFVAHIELITSDYVKRRENICERARSKINTEKESRSWTIIPNDNFQYLQHPPLDISADEAKAGGEYLVRVQGCVIYESTQKDGQHRTPFVANMSYESPGLPEDRLRQFPVSFAKIPVEEGWLKIKNFGIPGDAD